MITVSASRLPSSGGPSRRTTSRSVSIPGLARSQVTRKRGVSSALRRCCSIARVDSPAVADLSDAAADLSAAPADLSAAATARAAFASRLRAYKTAAIATRTETIETTRAATSNGSQP